MAKTSFHSIKPFKLGEDRRKIVQINVLNWSIKEWQALYPIKYQPYPEDNRRETTLHGWYNHAFARGWLDISFDLFRKIVTGQAAISDLYPVPRRVYGGWWRRNHWLDNRYSGTKYRKLDHHTKKVAGVKEQQRRDWRKQKRFQEDRNYGSDQFYRPRSLKHFKNLSAKDHRAWVKQALHHENYDLFGTDGCWEYRQFIDPYLWD